MSIQAVYDAMQNYKRSSENYWRTYKDFEDRIKQEECMETFISEFDETVQVALYRLCRDIGNTVGVEWELTLSDVDIVCKLPEFVELYCYCKDHALDVIQSMFETMDRTRLKQLSVLTRFNYSKNSKESVSSLISPKQWVQFAEFRSNFIFNEDTTAFVREIPCDMKTMAIQTAQWNELDVLYKELVPHKKQKLRDKVIHSSENAVYTTEQCTNLSHSFTSEQKVPVSFSQMIESFTDSKKIYAALCLLTQCFFVQQKVHIFEGGPPRGWTSPPLTSEEKCQETTERKNQKVAYELFDQLLGGDIRYRLAFYFCHKARLLTYSLACRIVSQPPETCGIIASAALITRNLPCHSLQIFFNILESILDPHIDGCSEKQTRCLLKNNLNDWDGECGYSCSVPCINQNNFPVLILARLWMWMSFHDIAHQKNADILLSLKRKVFLLYPVTLINECYSFHSNKPFKQEKPSHRADHQALLDFVISSIDEYIEPHYDIMK